MTDAFGATPLPPVSADTQTVWYNPNNVPGQPQQPHAQQVAAFEANPNDDCKNGSVLDVNQHFLVYAVKNGLLRVLHRASSVRSLLRGHSQKITDVVFFQNGDVLGTVGGNVIIWRIFYTSPEIHAEKLLEIPTMGETSRIIWHPFNPNQFWLLHLNRENKNVATLVETTRITTSTTTSEPQPQQQQQDGTTSTAGHAVCQLYNDNVVMDGAVLIANESSITDLCWSGKDTRHVMTCHENGNICLWNVKQLGDALPQGHVPATCISMIQYKEPVTKCLFLPHDNIASDQDKEEGLTSAFCTASRNNSCITIWSSFYPNQDATQLQEFGFSEQGDFNLDVCYGQAPPNGSPPAFFLLLSNREEGQVYTLHLNTIWSTTAPKRALAVGLDYVTPLIIKYPIYSWSIACVPAESVSEEEPIVGGLNFDLRFFAYQSKMVQQYTVPHYMCCAPSHTWSPNTPGVRVESSTTLKNEEVPVNTVQLMNTAAASYEEEYELEEIEDEDDEYEEAPAASALPTPDGLDNTTTTTTSASSNPFANWLGAIAGKTTSHASGNVPPPPTPVMSTPVTSSSTKAGIPPGLVEATPLPNVMGGGEAFLKPGELLSPGSMTDMSKAVEALSTTAKPEPKKKKRDKSPKPNGGGNKTQPSNNPPKIAILKRGDEAPPAAESNASNVSTLDLEQVLTKTLAAHFKRQENFISDQVQKAVKSEMQTIVVPTLSKMMTQTMEQAVVKPVKAAIDKNAKERTKVQTDVIVSAVSGSVQEPLQNAFEQAMTTALVPAYEVATREMFFQVAASLEKGLAGGQSTDSAAVVEALSAKLDTMSRTMESLTTEVEQLRSALGTSQGISPSGLGIPKSLPEPDAGQVVRDSILLALKQGEFEAAFTQALSASAADMAVYCCKNANVSDVLGGNSPAISQPILLCLMQQLGAVLVSSSNDDLQIILLWLQESALTLVPTDESIVRHVSQVLQQLVSSVEAKMALADPTLRRQLKMLLQVIQGMQR